MRNALASFVMLFAGIGCANSPLESKKDKDSTDSVSLYDKITLSMVTDDVDELFGAKGKQLAPLPGWPKTVGEVEGYENDPNASSIIIWVRWPVSDEHKWVAVGFGRTGAVLPAGSLTMPHAIVKKSGIHQAVQALAEDG